jgi:hypothetical protein
VYKLHIVGYIKYITRLGLLCHICTYGFLTIINYYYYYYYYGALQTYNVGAALVPISRGAQNFFWGGIVFGKICKWCYLFL